MTGSAKTEIDDLTRATVTIAWVIVLNKPFYPLYVWWVAESGVTASLSTLLATPLFLAVALLARRRPLAARVALPLVGAADTLVATTFLGFPTGTMLFLAPCIMLAGMSFRGDEAWWQRGAAAIVFVAFAIGFRGLGAPVHVWFPGEAEAMLGLNAFAVASLMAFVAIRYAGVGRER